MAKTTKDNKKIVKNEKLVSKNSTTSKKIAATKNNLAAEKKTAKTKTSLATTKKTSTTKKEVSSKTKNQSNKKSSIIATKKSTASTKNPVKVSKTTKNKTNLKIISSIVSEHYDLPNTYNKTFVVLLAQTPKMLFAFWDISEFDKKNLINKYGSHFFENTRPVLIIINKTTNTSFEIEVNDYAKDWYIDVTKTDCEFEIQLGRRPYNSITDDFILIATSNSLVSPNDHILLEKLPKTFKFLNLKTNQISEKTINTDSFSRIYNIYDFYKEMYTDELHNNPSSK